MTQAAPAPEYPRYRIEPGAAVDLAARDPGESEHYQKKADVADELDRQRKRIRELQARLYAEGRQALLIVLQATDSGGKDGTIKHVFRGVNPQGCRVWSFKQPSSEERSHDFLWRIHKKVPARGMIGIFNRSHYEDVLVVRVDDLAPREVWSARYDIINEWEHMLTESGVRIIKFFLHITRAEQKRRFQKRLDKPHKRWKFALGDLEKRQQWDDYQAAFEEAITRCSTPWAPWYVIPANHKWYRNLVVARTIATVLAEMDPQYPAAEADLDEIVIPD